MARRRQVAGQADVTVAGFLADTAPTFADIFDAAQQALAEKLRVIDHNARAQWPIDEGTSMAGLRVREVRSTETASEYSYGTDVEYGYYIRSARKGKGRATGKKVHAFTQYVRLPVLAAQRELVAEVAAIAAEEIENGD